MKKLTLLFITLFGILCYSNAQNPPVAVNDTVTVLMEQQTAINVLLNDYDPDGDEIKIKSVFSPEHGVYSYNDSIIFYTSDSYIGQDSLRYKIKSGAYPNNSDWAWVYITVMENPDVPIANPDQYNVLKLVPTELSLLDNDTDANGDELIISELQKTDGFFNLEFSEDSSSVFFISNYPIEYDSAAFKYRIKEKNTTTGYFSYWTTVKIYLNDNPEIPTAINDTINATGGVTVDIFVLDNDINPTGSQLEIDSVWGETLGAVNITGNHLTYTADFSNYGTEILNYKIKVSGQTYLYSTGKVIIYITSNPGRPVAVADTASGVCGEETVVDVLHNDYDPDNDEIEIKDVDLVYPQHSTFQIQNNKIYIYTVDSLFGEEFFINTDEIVIKYRVREVNNPDSYSEWATATVNMQQNAGYPQLHNDQASTIAGYPVEIDIFENDSLNGINIENKLHLYGNTGSIDFSNSKLSFTPYMLNEGTNTIVYYLFDFDHLCISYAKVNVEVEPTHAYDTLDINNIKAGINSDGYLFAKNSHEIPGESVGDSWEPAFEYPKGSGKKTIFCNSLWIGGLDEDDSLHLAAQIYKRGYDFQFGPVSDSYAGIEFYRKWSRVWKVSKDEIVYHINNYMNDDYEPVEAIINWPGNGDAANGQAEQLAPYYDKNENGIYEPMQGDYPLIRGDQCVLFIYNDDRNHTETQGSRMKTEIHGMAYVFDSPNDNLLNNTVFVHYDIYNRSENIYHDTYIGSFTETDLGYPYDDYIGSNVESGSYFCYNGNYIDEGEINPNLPQIPYGINPPTQSITFVAGPYMDDDGEDNSAGACDYGVNGLNFGDGVVDNERIGMTGFFYFSDGGNPAQSDPYTASEYYNYLHGLWKDGTPMMYGGTGYYGYPGTVGPECKFMFPGDSDSCNWGTNGVWPNDGYNQNGKYWTEETGNNGEPNPPGDRRGLGTTGPFTFSPGEKQELDLAFSVGQGDNGPLSSNQSLFENLEELFQRVDNGEIINLNNNLAVEEHKLNNININIYPNPTRNYFYVSPAFDKIIIYNTLGKIVKIVTNPITKIDIANLSSGIYYVKVIDNGNKVIGIRKIIKQ